MAKVRLRAIRLLQHLTPFAPGLLWFASVPIYVVAIWMMLGSGSSWWYTGLFVLASTLAAGDSVARSIVRRQSGIGHTVTSDEFISRWARRTGARAALCPLDCDIPPGHRHMRTADGQAVLFTIRGGGA